jgi:hypothetical protein
MIDKQDAAAALKEMARVLPGVGTYQDKEFLREADKELRLSICRRLDDLLGRAEWVKTDLAKKGALKHVGELEALSRQMEKVSRMLETASRGYAPFFASRKVDRDALTRLLEYDKSLLTSLTELEKAMETLTEERAAPIPEEISGIRERLRVMEKQVKDRALLFKTNAA